MLHSSQFQSLVDLDPVLSEIFFNSYDQVPMSLVGPIISQRTSTKAKETDLRLGSFTDPQEFNGQVFYDTPSRGYEIPYAHAHYTLGFKVAVDMLEDNQYAGIFDQTTNMGQAFIRKRVKDEASMFNNAFSGVLGYDGKTLCATAHPRSMTDATAVSNSLGTKALNAANLEEAITTLQQLGDDLGNTVSVMPTHLIVGYANRKKALELIGSELTPESGNNAVNTHAGLQLIVHPMITGPKWFVVDNGMSQRTAKWFDRLATTFGSTDDMANTLSRSFYGRMRYSFGWSDFRWVVGSNPS